MSKVAEPALVTLRNVPIVAVGVDWPGLYGPATFTREMLIDAVAAANDDPGIPKPRLKLSKGEVHSDEIANEPCFGVVNNLRFNEEDQTVYGDYEGVPVWLAKVLPAAYPNRSIEGVSTVKTATGGKWEFVITAVELLGVDWPGVLTLEDLPLLYGVDKPEFVNIATDVAASLRKEGGQVSLVKASVNVETVRREYYNYLDDLGNFTWWIKAVLLEPDQLVVSNDFDDELYLVNFSVDGDEISFEEPQPVKVEYVPLPKKKEEKAAAVSAYAAGMISSRKVAASYATADASGRVKASTEGGNSMDDETRKSLADKLGLPEDATPEQIQSTLAELNTQAAVVPKTAGTTGDGAIGGVDTSSPAPSTDPADAPEAGVHQGEPSATGPTAVKGDIVNLDRGTYEQLMAGARAGNEARAQQIEQEDKTVLEAALREGKFPPARLAHWQNYLKADREGAITALKALEPGLIPVGERGVGGGGEGEALVSGEPYPDDWFPELKGRKARLAAAQANGARVFTEAVS